MKTESKCGRGALLSTAISAKWGQLGTAPQNNAISKIMEQKKLVNDLIHFLSHEKACHEALSCLNSKAEISILIAQTVEIRVVYDGQKVFAEEKKALAPDFIFYASPSAVSVLIQESDLTPAQLGIKLFKQILSRDIKVAMPSSIFQVTRKGYFKMLTVGGVELLSELKQYNLASLPKIIEALKKLRP